MSFLLPVDQNLGRRPKSSPRVFFSHRLTLALASAAILISTSLFAWPSRIKFEIRYDQAQVVRLAYGDSGDILVTGHADGSVAVRNASNGKAIEEFQAHRGRVYQLAVQQSGDLMATGMLGKDNVKVWNAKEGKLKATLSQFDEAFGLAFSPDGKYLAISGASSGKTLLELWDLQSGKKTATLANFPVGSFVPGSILFSQDSRRVIVSVQNSMHGIHIWSINGQKLKTIPYNDDIISMSLHKNDSIAVGGTFGSKVVVFDLNSGRVLRTMTGHKGHITSVAAVDDNHAVSTSYKRDDTGPYIIWDIRTGQKVSTVSDKISSINEVVVNPSNGDIAMALNTFGNLGNPTTLIVYGN
ncbi:MAG: hypothetical protein CMN76_14275 [Spirochaetaceae bacterium]|nr:hypothetical protein [Spirochaetaceae bacterium]|tara:strand:- start:163342 stop:164406 length:1065 start_codon:yes stop_codon:yes gene_type:complete